MGKKVKVIISEADFTDLLVRNVFGGKGNDVVGKLLKDLKVDKGSTEKESGTETKTSTNTAGEFAQLDMNNPEDFDAYEKVADKFISSRSSNLLGIKGSMLADAAKNAQNKFGKYVPVELSLAQLAAEGGFSKDPNSRPIRTKNPYNVGNTDSGKNVFHSSVQSGIQRYYDLIAKDYLVGDKTASDLLDNFVNKNGLRYATAKYEGPVSQIANQVKNMGQPIFASLKKPDSNLT
jgi:hypothetical protein